LRRRVYRPQGWISPVLLINGRTEGTWCHEIKGSRVEVVIKPFIKAPVWVRICAGAPAGFSQREPASRIPGSSVDLRRLEEAAWSETTGPKGPVEYYVIDHVEKPAEN